MKNLVLAISLLLAAVSTAGAAECSADWGQMDSHCRRLYAKAYFLQHCQDTGKTFTKAQELEQEKELDHSIVMWWMVESGMERYCTPKSSVAAKTPAPAEESKQVAQKTSKGEPSQDKPVPAEVKPFVWPDPPATQNTATKAEESPVQDETAEAKPAPKSAQAEISEAGSPQEILTVAWRWPTKDKELKPPADAELHQTAIVKTWSRAAFVGRWVDSFNN